MVDYLTSTNSNNEKKERLAHYDDLKKIIKYTYDPMMQFYVTSKTIEKYPEVSGDWADVTEEMIFPLLNSLASRQISGHAALAAVSGFVEGHAEYKDLIYSIIDKNLKIRMSESLINKVFPDLIPEFKVQLADKFNIDKVPNFEKEKWFASRKLDGVRCIAVYKDKDLKFYSRTGKEFFTLEKVKEDILEEMSFYKNSDFILDGEMCIVDENGDENFTSIIKLIRKKDFTIKNPRYKIFDFMSLKDFENKSGETSFGDRYSVFKNIKSKSETLSVVEQVEIENLEDFNELSLKADKLGWEGLIIRKDALYAGKRSKNMLKVKQFHDDEYEVKNITKGIIRYISKETGLEEEQEMLSNVIIEHKGFEVGVGSGFSLEQRQSFYDNPELIIGKTINVKYFEESKDKNGNLSLRFPVVKHIYDGKRDV